MFARALVLAVFFTAAHAFLATPSLQSLCVGRQTQLRGCLATACKGSDASQRLGRRDLMAVLPVSILVAAPGIVAAAGAPSFKADSPGVALDAIIVMKVVKELRGVGGKLEQGDFKAVQGFLTNPWSSNTARFLRKNKVLESLATSLRGAAGGGDLDSDPAFANEASPDSIQRDAARAQLEGVAATVFEQLDALGVACEAKDADGAAAAYGAAVAAMDKYLAAAGLPSVADADPKLIKTP